MKHFFLSLLLCTGIYGLLTAQNVGIGTTTPAYKVDVVGKIHSTNHILTDGYVGIGTDNPAYKLQVNNGSVAFFNSADVKTWFFSYNNTDDYFFLSEGGTTRLTVANGGNVGIGTTTPGYKLDINGTANVETNLTVGNTASVDGNLIVGSTATVNGNLTVDNGKGILRSWNSTQLKYYTQQASVSAILGAFGTSPEAGIAWPTGIFSSPPKVFVGDIVSTGGTVGTLFRVQMITYATTADGCKFRLINTSNAAVNYDITWNIICIGN